MNKITLTSSIRSNLQSLKTISTQMDKTQVCLSTGKRVNSALDNATTYYQSRSLTNRAGDLEALLDGMGQGIQTIQSANEGIESGLVFLEQAKAVAEQALAQTGGSSGGAGGSGGGIVSRPIEDFVAEGYEVVSVGAGASEIEALIAGGATKLVLSGDLTLSESLNISSDVIIEGNGNKIVYNSGSGGSAIVVDGTSAEISNLIIEASGSGVSGIQAVNGGTVYLDTTENIKVSGGAQKLQNGNADRANLYAGESNTQAIVNQLGADGLAATAANQFYVGSKSGDFGQGTWYLPSIGELMDMYGTNTANMTSGTGTSGAVGDNMSTINEALATLAAKDSSVASRMSGYYWSSSE